MDAVELLRGDAPFVVDTSAWWRFSALRGDLAALVRAAGDDYRMWITPIVRMEILYSARSSSEYAELETDLDALRILRSDRAVADAAMSAIGDLLAQWKRSPPMAEIGARARAMSGFSCAQTGVALCLYTVSGFGCDLDTLVVSSMPFGGRPAIERAQLVVILAICPDK